MKILLISDNHGYSDQLIINHAKEVDEIWHAGDWLNNNLWEQLNRVCESVIGVYGNIDGIDVKINCPLVQKFERQGMRIFITHIAGKPGNYKAIIQKEAKDFGANIFVCGHSHMLLVQYDKVNSWLHLNPGAIGLHGFHKERTALKFEINKGKVENMKVIEWDRLK